MTDFRRFGSAVNADLYLEDNSLLGLAKEFKIPDLEWKTVEIETLGQIAVYKAPSRVLEAMEGSIKIQAAEPDLLADFYNPTITHKLQMHQQVDINGPDGVDLEKSFTLITLASVRFFKTEFGGASLGEAEEIDLEFSCSRLIQRVHDSDNTLLEVDVFANVARNTSGDFWRQ